MIDHFCQICLFLFVSYINVSIFLNIYLYIKITKLTLNCFQILNVIDIFTNLENMRWILKIYNLLNIKYK